MTTFNDVYDDDDDDDDDTAYSKTGWAHGCSDVLDMIVEALRHIVGIGLLTRAGEVVWKSDTNNLSQVYSHIVLFDL